MTPESRLAAAILQQAWEEIATGKPALPSPSPAKGKPRLSLPASQLKHAWLSYISAIEVLTHPHSRWRKMIGLYVPAVTERVTQVLEEKFGPQHTKVLLHQAQTSARFDPAPWFADLRSTDCEAWRLLRRRKQPGSQLH